MSELELKTNIEAAVTAALAQQNEAYQYLENVKQNSPETWKGALAVFLDVDNGRPEARMYALQILDDFLQRQNLQESDLGTLRSSLFSHIQASFCEASSTPRAPVYVTNALVRTLFLLFLRTYTDLWPDFLSDFSNLIRANPNSPDSLDLVALDLYLRLLHEVSTQISDQTFRAARDPLRLQRDGELRDALREKHAQLVANDLFGVLELALDRFPNHQPSPSPNQIDDIACEALKVVAHYVGWIDINYVVSTRTLPVLQRCLSSPVSRIVISTLDALTYTASKGMPPDDKIQLVQLLDPISLVNQLVSLYEQRRQANAGGGSGDKPDPNFEDTEEDQSLLECTGKFLNAIGLEVTRIPEESIASESAKRSSYDLAQNLRPYILRFIGSQNHDTSSSVLPFINSLLSLYKKEKKRSGDYSNVERQSFYAQLCNSQERIEFYNQLLRVVLQKMKYTNEDEWSMSNEDDEALAFSTMRKELKLIADAVAILNEQTYTGVLHEMIISVVDTVSADSSAVSWKDAELALYLLFCYGEAIKISGQAGFVIVPPQDANRPKQLDQKMDYSIYPLSPLGDVILRVVKSPIMNVSHPSVPLMFFESVVRYHDFFQLVPECIPIVLSVFLDNRGLHHPSEPCRARSSYLFYRFVHLSKNYIQVHVSAEFVGNILEAMRSLLDIKPEITQQDVADGGDVLTKVAHGNSPFDSQLYLFEAIGSLIAILNQVPNEQESLLRATVGPLIERIRSNVVQSIASVEDLKSIITVHHAILAIAHLGKGFPLLAMRVTTPAGKWVSVFKESTDTILEATKALSSFLIIREAAISAFKIIVSTTGDIVLPQVPVLIDCVLYQLTASELVDFLPFLTLLLNKYKTGFTEYLDMLLLPVISRIDHFHQVPITGTDDAVQQADLRRAYFTLITSIFTACQHTIFISERNRPHLVSIFRSVVQYINEGDVSNSDVKLGFSVLAKFVQAFLPTADGVEAGTPPSTNGQSTPVHVEPMPELVGPVYDEALKLAFERPLSKDADFGDSAIFNLLSETSLLIKTIHHKRKEELAAYLKDVLCPSLNIPANDAQALINAITTCADGKQLKKPMVEFYQAMRGVNSS